VIHTANQDILASWLCKRIGYIPSQSIKCIGQVIDGQIAGVIGYDGFNGASVMMHVAGDPGWVTKSMLFAAFDYPFRKLGCKIVIGLVPSGNEAAFRFNQRLGFKLIDEIKDAHPDGSLLLMTMRPEDCRWLEARYGKEVITTART
jgi:RimJ/RimL family protein N-acetyltransferase